MNISNTHRFILLASNLVMHPSFAKRYLQHNLIGHRPPLQLGLPWFSYAAIDFLDGYLSPKAKVFEWGSGGSTLFFSKRCEQVWAIEDDEGWFEIVQKKIAEKKMGNVTLKHLEFDFRNPVDFEKSKYLNSIKQDTYDVIIVDGQDWSFNERPTCFYVAEQYVKPGGIIIVDDSWRYTNLRRTNKSNTVRTFQSVGPARMGVTSTDIFFY